MQTIERRGARRIEVSIPVECNGVPGTIVNVSATGALMRAHARVAEPGQRCEFTLALPIGIMVQLDALVVRVFGASSNTSGIAVSTTGFWITRYERAG